MIAERVRDRRVQVDPPDRADARVPESRPRPPGQDPTDQPADGLRANTVMAACKADPPNGLRSPPDLGDGGRSSKDPESTEVTTGRLARQVLARGGPTDRRRPLARFKDIAPLHPREATTVLLDPPVLEEGVRSRAGLESTEVKTGRLARQVLARGVPTRRRWRARFRGVGPLRRHLGVTVLLAE
jgi:hypothetical protein